MATSVIRNVLFQTPGVRAGPTTPRTLSLGPHHHHHHHHLHHTHHHTQPSTQELLDRMEELQAEREETETLMEEELMEEEDSESEVHEGEEEEEEEEEEEREVFQAVAPSPPRPAVDMTRQLLTFASLISGDVRRYFGAGVGACDAPTAVGDPPSAGAGGRLRYYDDLLKAARTQAPDGGGEGEGGGVASGLGPLAELFDRSRRTAGRPMVRRDLPLSFWAEPRPACSAVAADMTPFSPGGGQTELDTQEQYHAHAQEETHALDSSQPDFSDLLAHWDPVPDLPVTL